MKFYVVPWFGLLGAFLTWAFLPDTTGLDLKEQERRWAFIRSGREHDYHGVAINRKHLSNWEVYVRKIHKNYDAELDYQQRVEEMRHDWEQGQIRRAELEKEAHGYEHEDEDWHSDVSSYFTRTKGTAPNTPFMAGQQKEIPAMGSEAEKQYAHQ